MHSLLLTQGFTTAREGTQWLPANLVTDVVSTARKYVRVAHVSYDEFKMQNTTINQEKENINIPDSKLNPATTKKAAVVRYIATPIWKTADRTTAPHAVIIAGLVLYAY
jgi:hypothetical protein